MEPQVEPHSRLPTGLQTSRTHKRRTRRLRWTRLVIAALGAALVALAWICYDTREEMASLRTELGKRFAEGDSVARDARTLGYQNQA